jgi:GDP-mannose 6-dehydrogenase
MNIAIYGLGYVGLTAAACLTSEGHQVFGIDVSQQKVNQINAGISPIREPGLDELLAKAVATGRLKCSNDPAGFLGECEMAIVCVGTPSGPDGSHNMSFIAEVTRQIATGLDKDRKSPLTVLYRSTIRPGTMDGLITPIFENTLGTGSSAFELVYNPEFLRESSAIKDYFDPPKIIVGTHDGLINDRMVILNQNLRAQVFYTRFREAEITKFVDNSFHALKVAFANEIGRVCLQMDISAAKVHEIFVSDTKLNVSPYYLRPGGAFGGSCLPKDVRALQYIAADVGVSIPLLDSLLRSNDSHKNYLFEMVTKGLAPKARVLMLGLAFKRHSDDLRESPNVDMARKLLNSGFQLEIYDPDLKVSQIVGQNLGYSFLHLPNLNRLMITRDEAESRSYDLVVDMAGLAAEMSLGENQILQLNRLQ